MFVFVQDAAESVASADSDVRIALAVGAVAAGELVAIAVQTSAHHTGRTAW
jgi:hypothetical protein